MTSIRVLVVDDQAMFREGLVVLLGSAEDITVVGEAADGQQAVDRSLALSPDVVVMDIRMPGTDGIQATEQILAAQPSDDRTAQARPGILVLTTFDLDEHVYAALRAGASGFLLKDASRDELVHAVRVVASGQAILAPAVTRRLVTTFARQTPPPARGVGSLTSRESEVLALVAEGLSNAEIAAQLVVTTETVKTHVSRILNKLSLRDRTQAAVYAWEHRLVGPP